METMDSHNRDGRDGCHVIGTKMLSGIKRTRVKVVEMGC